MKPVPLLVLAVLLAYANCLTKTFVFDDDLWIYANPLLDRPAEYFQSFRGRPVLAATVLALDAAGRQNPLLHHVLNVAIHLAATLTLYGLVRRSLLVPRFRRRYAGRAEGLAFAVALLWAVHPVQVQSVTYIIQRGESLAGLFYLLILYALVRGDSSRRRCWWYALAVVSLGLGCGTKEILVTAPVATVLYDRAFLTKSVRRMVRRRWGFYLVFLLAWGAYLAYNLNRAAGVENGIGFGMEQVTPKTYLFTQAGVIVYYLRLCVWPTGTSIDYQGWPWARTLGAAMPAGAVVAGLLLLTAGLLWRRPAAGFVAAWFFIVLAPTSSVLPIVDPVFEHRLYLSLASVAVLVVFVGDRLLGRWKGAALGAAAVVLGVMTHQRNELYESRERVWRAAVERMPNNGRGLANLGQGLLMKDRPADAVGVLDRALALSATEPTALENMAAARELLGDFAAAEAYYQRLRTAYPKDGRWARLIGDRRLALGRWADAETAYRAALGLDPKAADAWVGLAAALNEQGRDGAAERQEATARNPDWPTAVLETARVTVTDERHRRFAPPCRLALVWAKVGVAARGRPAARDRDTLALCYAATGDFRSAAEQMRTALAEGPDERWAG
ncbi:MAG TPA: tetratricopeptide repeat protein, partial [Gemmataceae bacterium]|nr:tetratricopeptide repeat protein [Gemmataceae bacterium]